MDWNECKELENLVHAYNWVVAFTGARGQVLTDWVSKFHPDKASCEIEGEAMRDDFCGSFNWVSKIRFATGETWAVRFPRGGKVEYPDEKVEAEVATIQTIRQHTDIPVPEIKAWGRSADNELGLGPFIMSTFVEGIGLANIWKASVEDRVFNNDVPDESIEVVYRQIARFMLQLSRIDFDRIGSLCPGEDGQFTLRRPLTQKAHDILHDGGVDVLGPIDKAFTSSEDYFNHLCEQDLKHLQTQLNSVDDAEDAARKFTDCKVVSKLVQRFALSDYQHGPFKLHCDDFGPLNMLVDNADDLNIVAVLDWEWSYAGPQEYFWSPPRWLIGRPPGSWPTSGDHLQRYSKYLDMYIRLVEEQEQDVLGTTKDSERPSELLRRYRDNGSMWFYHVIRECFNGPDCPHFKQLRAAVPDFTKLAEKIPKDEMEAFVKQKLEDLEKYSPLIAEKKETHAELIALVGWTGKE